MGYQPFSVAISVYKNDDPIYFDRALESITDFQTVKPDEVVLVIDGPVSNEINAIINKYSSRYNFKIINLEINHGLGDALKIATENCSYELIARMDSDDISAPNRFEQQLSFMDENPLVDIVGGNISEFVDSEDNIISYRIVPTSDLELKEYIKKRCPFNHMTVMFKKTSILSAGGYLKWHYNEDYYLWIRMALSNCVFANINNVLVNVRTGMDQFARRGGKKYYKSEKKIQQLMLQKAIITRKRYFINIAQRFIIQILVPNCIRGKIYKIIRNKRG